MPGRGHSLQRSELAEGPVDKHGLAIDISSIHRAPYAAVIGGFTVIPEHVIVVGLHQHRGITLVIKILCRQIRLLETPAIHINMPIADADNVSGEAYHPFDIGLAGIQWVPEND